MALTQVASGLIASVSGASLTGTQNIPKATLPTGSVLQVVQGTVASSTSTASTSFVYAGLTASITPSSASNKVLIITSITSAYISISGQSINFTVYRNGSNIAPTGSGLQQNLIQLYSTASAAQSNLSNSILDSPATTSAITYSIYFAANTGTVYYNANNQTSYIQLLEISA